MNATDFIAEVRRRTGCTRHDALRASRATLMTLAERLPGDQPRHLATQLPPELAGYLLGGHAVAEDLTPDEFLRRVSQREGVDLKTAGFHARAVVEILRETVVEAERKFAHWPTPTRR